MNIEKYIGERFDWKTNNCADFVCRIWRETQGVDLGDTKPQAYTFAALRRKFAQIEGELVGKTLRELPEPTDFCIAYFERDNKVPHVGILINKTQLLHLPKFSVSCLHDFEWVKKAGGFNVVRYFA